MNKTIAFCTTLMALIFQLFLPVLAAEEILAANQTAETDDQTAKDQNVFAEDILDLRVKKTFSITAGLQAPLRNRGSEQFLLSIDGKDLRDYSFEEIKKKLAGPKGSSVSVEIGFQNGDTETFDIKREPNKRRYRNSQQDPYIFLERSINNVPNSYVNIRETTTCNSDLIGKARSIRAAKESKDLVSKVAVYLDCMVVCQAFGDFVRADRFLELALNSMKNDPPTSHTSYREKAVIQNLVLLGKYDEAESLCKYHLLPAPNRVPRLPAAITVLDSYSLIPTDSARKACRDLAAGIFTGKTKQVVSSFHQDSYWFAQYLESLGWNDKALEVYSKQIEKMQNSYLGEGFYGRQAVSFGLYSRARLEALAGKRDLAEKDLEAIKKNYSDMSPKQQALINRIPEFFPTFADVENALSALNKSAPIAPPPRTGSFSNQDHYVVDGSLPSFKRNFQKAQKCSDLIKAKNKKDAEKIARELIIAYEKSKPVELQWYVRQNLFCTCLGIARAFTNQGWFEESNKLLKLLEAAAKKKVPEIAADDLTWIMIAAERIYNTSAELKFNASAAAKKPNWTLLQEKEGKGMRLPWPNRLSTLAMAYHYADCLERAEFFINKSMEELKNSNQVKDTAVDTRNAAERQAQIYIDAACIYAKRSDFRNADNFLDHALKNQFELNESIARSILEAATIYSENGRANRAILFLERTRGLKPPRFRLKYVENIEFRHAELLGKVGKLEKALGVIKELLSKSTSPAKVEESLLAAELCEQAKKYEEAANYYYEAGKWHGSKLEKQRREILQKAITCASKVPNFDKAQLAKIYLQLSGLIERGNLAKGLAIREKAVSMMSDSDPEKPKQLSVIAYIKGELSKQSKGTGSNSKSVPNSKRAQQDEVIALAKKAAEMSSKNNSKESSSYWLRLARAEAQANRVDEAVKHAHKCLEAYKPVNVRLHTLYDLMSSNLPLLIAKAGSPEKAEMIMKAAQTRVESVAGAGSLQAQAQMSHYFDYLVLQKEYEKAGKILDKFLSTNLDQGSYAPPNHDMHICRFGGGPYPVESSMNVIRKILSTVKSIATYKENSQTLRFLNKILKAEIKQFGKEDYRVSLTYAEIARVHARTGEDEKAYEGFTKAVTIMHKYEDMMFVLSNLNPDFYNILRKLDKKSEIESFEETKLEELKNRQKGLYRRRPSSRR